MGDNEQQLFLAEFLVDRVKVPTIRAMHTEMLPVTTCVSFQILNLPPINIHQESTSENCTCLGGDTQVFRKGKSCLFALPSIVLEKPLQSFPINMSVYKKLPPGMLPDVMLIGSHKIETKDLINVLLHHHLFKTGNPCKTMKESFKIKTATGQHVGEVTVFLRISCFGEKIVTQFQIPHNKKPYLFKGIDESPVFQCKKIPSDLEEKTPPVRCNCETTKLGSNGDENEDVKPRTCCPMTISPDCPPPTRQVSSENFSTRPCCPSRRGEKCPTTSEKSKTASSRIEKNRSTLPQTTKKRAGQCGCWVEE